MKLKLSVAFLTLALAAVLAGCGGDSAADPASIAPVDSSVFVAATLRPQGAVRSNLEALAKEVSDIDNLGGKIVAELEKEARKDGEPLDFAKEVKPWLGEEGGIYLTGYDGDDFTGSGFIVQTTDPAATQDFIDNQAGKSDKPVTDGTYEGVEYKMEADKTTIGVVDDFLVIGDDKKSFEAAVDAADGESLAEADRYSEAIAAAPEKSLGSVYVDIGLLIEEAGPIDSQAKLFLQSVGIDPSEATAIASAVPSSSRKVEIDISTNLAGDDPPPPGDASAMLGSLPIDSSAAIASSGFGRALGSAIDGIDADGIPGQVPPHQFKLALKRVGIDLDRVTSSIGDLGVFVVGNSIRDLDAGVVLSTDDADQAQNTVANVGLLLRASHTPGVTALGGKLNGFSVRSDELGRKPIVVAAKGKRIAICYGLPAAQLALATSRVPLSESTSYQEAVASLGKTPISGFVYGPGALELAESFIPTDDDTFRKVEPYLTEIFYIAIGREVSEGRATARLIVDFVG